MGTHEDSFVDTFGLPIHIANTVDLGVEASLGHPLPQPVSCVPILRGERQSVHPTPYLTERGKVTQISEQAGIVDLHEYSPPLQQFFGGTLPLFVRVARPRLRLHRVV